MTNARELRAQRGNILDNMKALIDRAEAGSRDLTREEKRKYDLWEKESDDLGFEIERRENGGVLRSYEKAGGVGMGFKLGEEERAAVHYFRSGDRSGLRDMHMASDGEFDLVIHLPREMRAVDSTMNITTAADGGYTVPTGFSGQVAGRRNELRISTRLGVRQVPGQGTTVNFPFENADPNVLAATSEQSDAHANNYERDAVVFGNKAFTLAKKTKKLELTEELLDDEDVGLLNYIADHMGRAIALTHNAMLLTEVAANGTLLKTFASATAIAAGEVDDMVFHSTLGFYLDDGDSIGWVMRPPTLGMIKKITGNARQYGDTTGGDFKRVLLEYPVIYSNSAAAVAASAKSVYFGNWYYVGMREDPALRIVRDPYSVDGIIVLKYSFRAVYGVLIAGGVGFASHPSA